jgi:hypothetical protein
VIRIRSDAHSLWVDRAGVWILVREVRDTSAEHDQLQRLASIRERERCANPEFEAAQRKLLELVVTR